jgi:hypothetical protein
MKEKEEYYSTQLNMNYKFLPYHSVHSQDPFQILPISLQILQLSVSYLSSSYLVITLMQLRKPAYLT